MATTSGTALNIRKMIEDASSLVNAPEPVPKSTSNDVLDTHSTSKSSKTSKIDTDFNVGREVRVENVDTVFLCSSSRGTFFDAMGLGNDLAADLLIESIPVNIPAFQNAIEAAINEKLKLSCLEEGNALICALRSKRGAINNAAKLLDAWWKSPGTLSTFIEECIRKVNDWVPYLLVEKVLCQLLNIQFIVCEHSNGNVFRNGKAFGDPKSHCLRIIRVDSHFVRIDAVGDHDAVAFCKSIREDQICRLHRRAFYGEEGSDAQSWDYWFRQLKSTGISNLLERYKKEYLQAAPLVQVTGASQPPPQAPLAQVTGVSQPPQVIVEPVTIFLTPKPPVKATAAGAPAVRRNPPRSSSANSIPAAQTPVLDTLSKKKKGKTKDSTPAPNWVGAPNSSYYFEAENDAGKWVKFIPSNLRITVTAVLRRKPAVLFREYLTRIGGDNSIDETIGDEWTSIELFEVQDEQSSKHWITLNQCCLFPLDPLKLFLERELDSLQNKLLVEFIGQPDAKKSLITEVIAESMYAVIKGRSFKINDYNQVFVGEPGTGKTTLAQLTGNLLYYCGLLRIGHVVICTGAQLGQGTGNADQTSLYVKRLYQRATDGVLFIDELYGITPRMDRGEQGTANQVAAIAAITDLSLHEQCCTIAAGYVHEIQACFFDRNEGLKRRFKQIPFQRFDDWELYNIFLKDAEKQKLEFTDDAIEVLVHLFAGFTAPDRNGAFCKDLVLALHGQIANRLARTYGTHFNDRVHPEDAICCWKKVIPAIDQTELDFDDWLSEIRDSIQSVGLEQRVPSKELMSIYAKPKVPAYDPNCEPLREFILECCACGTFFSVTIKDFYAAYRNWSGPAALKRKSVRDLLHGDVRFNVDNNIVLGIKVLHPIARRVSEVYSNSGGASYELDQEWDEPATLEAQFFHYLKEYCERRPRARHNNLYPMIALPGEIDGHLDAYGIRPELINDFIKENDLERSPKPLFLAALKSRSVLITSSDFPLEKSRKKSVYYCLIHKSEWDSHFKKKRSGSL